MVRFLPNAFICTLTLFLFFFVRGAVEWKRTKRRLVKESTGGKDGKSPGGQFSPLLHPAGMRRGRGCHAEGDALHPAKASGSKHAAECDIWTAAWL